MPPADVIPAQPENPPPTLESEPKSFTENPWEPSAEIRDWTAIVIHHTATDQGSVESIHETHLDREWLGIGYHFVIGNGNGMPDGEIEPTFRWREQLHGAHAGSEEYNQHGIGIALVGNFEEQPPTGAQLAAVKRLVAVLKSAYEIESERVIGHGEVKATACPGKMFPIEEVSQVTAAACPPGANWFKMTNRTVTNRSPAVSFPPIGPAGWANEPQRSAVFADPSGSRLP